MSKPPQELIEKYGLESLVEAKLDLYFRELGEGDKLQNFYDRFLAEVERPLLRLLQEKTSNNKSKMAHMLGLHRNTLVKKMKLLGLE